MEHHFFYVFCHEVPQQLPYKSNRAAQAWSKMCVRLELCCTHELLCIGWYMERDEQQRRGSLGPSVQGHDCYCPPLSILELLMYMGLVEVSTPLVMGCGTPLQPSVMNCSCDFLSATGYGSSPRIFHSCLRLIPGCLSQVIFSKPEL